MVRSKGSIREPIVRMITSIKMSKGRKDYEDLYLTCEYCSYSERAAGYGDIHEERARCLQEHVIALIL